LASGGALSRVTLRRNLEVHLPSEPLRNPARTPSPDTLGASGGRHSGGERLKANSGNDYREMVTRKIAVPNPLAKAENLCLTRWQDTREAVRAGFNIFLSAKGADVKQIIMSEIVVLKIVNGNAVGYNAQGGVIRTITNNAVSAVINGDIISVTKTNGQVEMYDANRFNLIRTI